MAILYLTEQQAWVAREGDCLIVSRSVKESGNVQVPWRMEGVGQLMTSSATLMERAAPYHLAIELARDALASRGVEVSEIQDFPWGSFVFFRDPDGNGWAVQQVPARP